MDSADKQQVFRFFIEVGIIANLGAKIIEKHLPHRLTNIHFGMLNHLALRPNGAVPKQMAFAFQIPKTSMTHMLRVLEELELICVEPNPDDARSKLARIKPKGLALIDAAVNAAADEFEIGRAHV